MKTKLVLIRHGLTEWNIEKRYCGFNDVSLSIRGKKQAEFLRDRIKNQITHKIYSSDRKRAIETSIILFGKKKIEIVPGLREMHFGIFESLTHKQILSKYASIYSKWLKNPELVDIPKGERLSDFKRRVIDTIEHIALNNPGKTVAIVCHGGVISMFITHLKKRGNFWKFIPHSASISIVEFRKPDKTRIISFNDIKHLPDRCS